MLNRPDKCPGCNKLLGRRCEGCEPCAHDPGVSVSGVSKVRPRCSMSAEAPMFSEKGDPIVWICLECGTRFDPAGKIVAGTKSHYEGGSMML